MNILPHPCEVLRSLKSSLVNVDLLVHLNHQGVIVRWRIHRLCIAVRYIQAHGIALPLEITLDIEQDFIQWSGEIIVSAEADVNASVLGGIRLQ